MPSKRGIPLRDIFNWRPQDRQAKALDACGLLDWFLNDGPVTEPKANLIGYGGAAGGGKTDTMLAVAIIIAHAFPGSNVTFFRRKYPELEGADGAIQRSMEMFTGIGKYNNQQHKWTFPDVGSYFFFRHCQNEKDRYNYQGQAFNVLLVDEATHFTWKIIDYLLTRNRAVVPGLIPFAFMGTNPGNIGHVWYSELFDVQDLSGGIEGKHEQVKHRKTQESKYEDVYFIPARLEDNKILMEADPDYERKLESRAPELVEALRYGNWMVFAGQAFRNWRRERHVVEPIELPEKWMRWRAVDWGYESPFSCHWYAKDPDNGRIFVYREAYETHLDDRKQAELIRDMTPESENCRLTYADPSMWIPKTYKDKHYSTSDEYAAAGVMLTRGDNARINGKRKVTQVLEDLPDGYPGLIVFSNCKNLIRTIATLVLDDVNVEDVDTDQEDHAYDDLRYGLTNYKLKEPEDSKDTQDQIWKKYEAIL